MERKRQALVLLIFLFASAVLMLFLSTSSPLYPTNPWVDANCYVTVARGMRAGMLPYRDLMEQKGPLLYALHLLAVLISPNGFFGVYLLEVAACTLFLYASYRTLRLLGRGGGGMIALLIAVAAALGASAAFMYGDSAEELCAPALSWSMFEALRYFREDERMRPACLLRNGALAGCVLWTKYSLLGLHFAWMAIVAIDCVARERRIGRALRMCLSFLAGMALSSLPWLIYFGANGALGDLFRVYFVQNLSGYYAGGSLPVRMARSLLSCARRNQVFTVLVAAGAMGTLLSRKMNGRMKLCLAAMLACTAVFSSFSGKKHIYMFYVWAPFAPLALVPLSLLIDGARGRAKRLARAGTIALAGGNMISKLCYPREELPQTKFAQEIARTPDAKILNCGFLDGGFYLAAGTLPSQYWFCRLNLMVEDCYREQARAIENGELDYVITRKHTLPELKIDDSRYELILREEDGFADLEGRLWYCLYRREDAAVSSAAATGEKT